MAIPAFPRRRTAAMVAGVAAVMLAAGLTGCDANAGPVATSPRQVTVVGSGEVRGAPDTLTADVGIEVVAPDATAAMNQSSDRQRTVIEALTTGGIDAKDISTTGVNLQPDTGPGTRSRSGFATSTRPRTGLPRSLMPAATPPASTRSPSPSRTTRHSSVTLVPRLSATPRTGHSSTRSCPVCHWAVSFRSLRHPAAGRRWQFRCREPKRWQPRCRWNRVSRP